MRSMTKPVPDPMLQSLDMRSREIFRRIVDSYLKDGEPVGSRNLSRMLPSVAVAGHRAQRHERPGAARPDLCAAYFAPAGCRRSRACASSSTPSWSSATSAEEERRSIETQLKAAGSGATLEQMLIEASQMLSGMSRGAGLVLATKNEVPLKHIEFIQLDPRRALAIMVSQNGDVENRVVELPAGVTASQLHRGLELPQRPYARPHAGRGQERDRAAEGGDRAPRSTRCRRTWSRRAWPIWAGAESGLPARLIVRGRANLLENLTAQADIELLKHLFEDLETQEGMVQLLDLAEAGSGVRIFIGSENKLFSLSGSSLVVAPYRDKDARVVGALGVIGPTRLNYARIVPMVDYTAQLISRLLR